MRNGIAGKQENYNDYLFHFLIYLQQSFLRINIALKMLINICFIFFIL